MIYVDVNLPLEEGEDPTKVAVRAGIRLHEIVGFGLEYVDWNFNSDNPDGSGCIKVSFKVRERDDV